MLLDYITEVSGVPCFHFAQIIHPYVLFSGHLTDMALVHDDNLARLARFRESEVSEHLYISSVF